MDENMTEGARAEAELSSEGKDFGENAEVAEVTPEAAPEETPEPTPVAVAEATPEATPENTAETPTATEPTVGDETSGDAAVVAA